MCFITLTYSNDEQTFGNLDKTHLQLFIKRLRKKYKKPITYYAIGEYGGKTFRPHYHIILFGVSHLDVVKIENTWASLGENFGFVYVGNVTVRSISYVAKYHVNRTKYPAGLVPSFCLMSKGVGKTYVDRMKRYHKSDLKRNYYNDFSIKRKLPRYYADKIYNRIEKDKIKANNEMSQSNMDRVNKWLSKHPNSKHVDYYKDLQARYEEAQRLFNEKSTINQKI